MLLKSLKLRNIRSYAEQTITFPEGSILLAGDIGAGKSSILLAIEFALFGASRPDLPGEMLLRKGATEASTELHFQIGGREVMIYRALKMEKGNVRQLPGSLTINSVRKELMPVELKAEVLSLLGYPEGVAAKNKNYIFRYTVYTPQEEMKAILQDDAETRLDILRKIFSIDKYPLIRENLQIYLKILRERMRLLEVKVEPLAVLQQQLQELEVEASTISNLLQELRPKLEGLRERLQQQESRLRQLEEQQQEFLRLRHRRELLQQALEEKRRRREEITASLLALEQEIAALKISPDASPERLQAELRQWENRKQQIIASIALLQERRQVLQQQLGERLEELKAAEAAAAFLPAKSSQLDELHQALRAKEKILQRLSGMEKDSRTLGQELARHEAPLEESRRLLQSLASLEICPLCRQEVTDEHRRRIGDEVQAREKEAGQRIAELKARGQEAGELIEEQQQKLNELLGKETLAVRLSMEVEQLESRMHERELKQAQVQHLQSQLGLVQQELAQLETENSLPFIDECQRQCEKALQRLNRQSQLQFRVQELRQDAAQKEKAEKALNTELQEVQRKAGGIKEVTSEIQQQKMTVMECLQEEKSLAVQEAQQQAQLSALQHRQQQVREQRDACLREQLLLERHRELHHWLEDFFIPLTLTIERQVMGNIHNLFNRLFQEWFSILLDGEAIAARLDRQFYPVIEQNGYEIAFTGLSGGEKTSAALAYRLALNRVINDFLHSIATKELLILDEPTDGFSSEQLDKVREVLERLNLRQTVLVSHESKIESFVDNVLRIQKAGEVSTVAG